MGGAVENMVRALAPEIAPRRINGVSPGMVDTPFFDEAKPDKLKPEDIAGAVIFALSQDPRAEVREVHVMPTA